MLNHKAEALSDKATYTNKEGRVQFKYLNTKWC